MNKLSIASKLILAFIFLPLCLNAQDEKAATLFGDNEIRTDGYGAFEIKLSQLDGSFAGFLLGGRAGVIINNVFSIGGGGYALMPTKKVDCPIPGHEKEKNNFWTGGYGGLFFEYINSSNNLLHFTANTLIAAGGITYVNHDNYRFDTVNYRKHPASFVIVLEPGVTVDLNVAKIFRLALGVSYRYSPNFELKDDNIDIVSNTAFNGVSVNLAFKFLFSDTAGNYKNQKQQHH